MMRSGNLLQVELTCGIDRNKKNKYCKKKIYSSASSHYIQATPSASIPGRAYGEIAEALYLGDGYRDEPASSTIMG
jgi:hypothetical protein